MRERAVAAAVLLCLVVSASVAVDIAAGSAPAGSGFQHAAVAGAAPRVVQRRLFPSTTSTTYALPQPVDVPADPYAPEPVAQIGAIDIPKIGLHQPLFQGITLHNIDRGPSHWPGSAMPGQRGNAVFAGHRVTHSHPFLRINELVAGDTVLFSVATSSGTRRSVYEVTGSEVVAPTAMEIVAQHAEATATLFACHPLYSASQRYVVHMRLLSTVVAA